MKTRYCSDRNGFTLIEILVAVALLMIVIGAIYGAFRAGNQSSVMVEESADLNQTARVILGRMDSELRSIYRRSGQQTDILRGENSEDNGGPLNFDKITFTTVSHEPCKKQTVKGDVCKVSYSAEYDSDNKPLGLYVSEDYTPDLHVNNETTDSESPVKVSDLVVGMNCTYLDPDTEEWVDQWVDKTTLPMAVRIELILKSGRSGSKPVTVVSTTNIPSWSESTAGSSSGVSGQGGSSAQQ